MLPIRTDRLLLRPVEPGDVDAMHAYKSQPDVCRYIPHSPMSRDEVIEWIARRSRADINDEGQALPLSVIEQESGEMIGDVVLFYRSREHRHGEIGYVFSPEWAGRGYATEAARALLRFGFEQLHFHRMTAVLDARNLASVAVLERLGMRREAHHLQDEWFKGEWSDSLIYAILADEWQAQQAGSRVE